MGEFQFNPASLLSVLQSSFYKVPIYQRSYSWDINQIEDFWNDISKAIEAGDQYFLGTLVFSTEDINQPISVIDGQQRIATTTILLAALRDQYHKHGDFRSSSAYNDVIAPRDLEDYEEKPRIRLNAKDHPFYSDLIIYGKKKTPELDSHIKIEKAFEYFSNKLEGIINEKPAEWPKEFASIYKFLNKQARVITVRAPTDADAFTIFETLNDRGADLTIADLLKNFLFSRASAELDVVQDRWQASQLILNEYQEEKEFLIFLRHLWSSTHGATRERDLYRSIKNYIINKQDATRFAKQLEDGAKTYGAILSTENEFWFNYSKQSKTYLASLNQFNLQQSRPTLLAILQLFSKEEIEKSLRAFVAISVRGLITGGIGGGQAERYLCDAAVAIRKKEVIDCASLIAKLRPIIPTDSEFERAFGSFSTRNNRFARYILLCLEKTLQSDPEPEFVPNDDVEQVNLEHILPKNAKKSEWPAFTNDELSSYPYRIGNMTLLQKGTNGKIGNKGWNIKRPKIASSRLKINNDVHLQADWRTGEIESRQLSLAKTALTTWRV